MKSDNLEMIEVIKFIKEYEKSGRKLLSSEFVQELEEMLKEENQEIEYLESILPNKYIIVNNKLMNALALGQIEEGITNLSVSKNKKAKIVTQITLNYNDENIKIYDKDKNFNPYDRAVHNAICSLWDAGNTSFTPDQVYRSMNGLTESEFVSPQSIEAITKSIDKSRGINVKIDYKDEAKSWLKLKDGDLDEFIKEDRILPTQKTTVRTRGLTVTAYKLGYKPLLYEYAQISGQVLTIPIELLNVKGLLNNTKEVILLREYLIRRIEIMKNNKNQSNKIVFSTIYEEMRIPTPTNKKAKTIRDDSIKLLDHFKDINYIKNHNLYKKGRSFHGIEIIY